NVQGTILGGGVVANLTPAAFAVAVVPAGTEVDFSGTLTAEQGASVPVGGNNLAPEPASAGLLLAAACVIGMGRRRRNVSSV
ncbi:MAG TPA: PEP-CTERM sorting domain-containing protein, partial [Humisphaera sp.]|nr:PEP-CTERM sorting domain-containing protein [Humisphaera sp.]